MVKRLAAEIELRAQQRSLIQLQKALQKASHQLLAAPKADARLWVPVMCPRSILICKSV